MRRVVPSAAAVLLLALRGRCALALLAAAAASALGAIAGAEDLTIVSKSTWDGGAHTTKTYITTDKIRKAPAIDWGPGQADTIVDAGAGQVIWIDHDRKTYWIETQAEIDEMLAKIAEYANSPEVKKEREAMKDLPRGPKVVEKLGTTRKIASYTCENYTLKFDYTVAEIRNSVNRGALAGSAADRTSMTMRSEQCLSTELELPIRVNELNKKYQESGEGMGPMMGIDDGKMKEQKAKLKGYLMADTMTTDVEGHKSEAVIEVVEVTHGPIPASVWEIPAGYTKVDSMVVIRLRNPPFARESPKP